MLCPQKNKESTKGRKFDESLACIQTLIIITQSDPKFLFPVSGLSINLLLSSASISQSATSLFSSTQIFLITAHSIGWSSSLKTSEALTPTSQEFVI